jgi:hypothetical protein
MGYELRSSEEVTAVTLDRRFSNTKGQDIMAVPIWITYKGIYTDALAAEPLEYQMYLLISTTLTLDKISHFLVASDI